MLDPNEVKKFFMDLRSWDSERDQDNEYLKNLTRKQRKDLLHYISASNSVLLDTGCGDGRIIQELSIQKASHVVGIDISSYVLIRAKERLKETEVLSHFIQCDIENLPFRSFSFNAATCIDTLVHIQNPRKALAELSLVLTPCGVLAVNTTNKNPIWRIKVQNDLNKFLRDVFLYHFPAFIVNFTLKVLNKKMIGKHMTENEFIFYVEDNFNLVELLRYGESPPVYFMAIAIKPVGEEINAQK
jgi:ubiquinone/menaquinone biosynthesis C-methylase UbiE